MRGQRDVYTTFLVPALAVLFIAAVIHVAINVEPDPPQYSRESLPLGFEMPMPMIELVIPKSPLSDYPSDGFDWTNFPLSSYRLIPVSADHKPLISVVTLINSVGAVQYLNESLLSLMQQSLQDFEWILMLSSSEIVQMAYPMIEKLMPALGDKHAPIYAIQSSKPSSFMEYLIQLGQATNGSYIFHLAVDSMLEPTALEKVYWHLRTHEAPHVAAVSGQSVYLGSDKRLLPAIGFQLGELMLEKFVLPTEMLWRKEDWLELRTVDEVVEPNHLWYNWLRLMSTRGLWGSTIQEYLAWERLDWQMWKWTSVDVTEGARRTLRTRYKDLFTNGFKPPVIPASPPIWLRGNPLEKGSASAQRLLILADNFVNSVASPTIGIVSYLQRAGFAVTLAVLYGQQPHQLYITSDVFFLSTFLPKSNFVPFLSYLSHSRSFDSILFVGSIPFFLSRALRHVLPQANMAHYLPYGTPSDALLSELLSLREAGDAKEPLLMPLDEWVESPSTRLFQRQNYLLRTEIPVILLPMGESLTAANETAQLIAFLESTRIFATVVLLRDRLASLEPWSSVHPMFRWGFRNTTSSPTRILLISTYEQDTYRAWLRAADGVLLFDGSTPDIVLAWHRIALSGGWLALGPSVRHAGLPQSIARSSSVVDLYERLKELIASGAPQKQATKEEASIAPPKSLESLLQLIQRASPSPVSQLSAEQLQVWVEQQAKAIGWSS